MIRLENICKSFGKKILFNNINYYFPAGERIALVGPNGAGKSTLLNIICGLDESDDGTIICPGQINMGYLPQEPNSSPKITLLEECLDGALKIKALKKEYQSILELMTLNYSDEVHKKFEKIHEKMQELGIESLESKAKGILLGLGFLHEQFTKSPSELSGGWRMRLELAKVFLNDPDFLVLDEPTNHLDLPSLIWVEKFLQGFKGTLLFVSHDKPLLNRLSTMTLHLNQGNFTPYKGNFDSFLEQREQKMLQDEQSLGRLRKRMQDVQKFVDRFKAKASKAKQAQSRMKLLSRLKELEDNYDSNDFVEEMTFRLTAPKSSGKEVLKIENLSIGYNYSLSKNMNLKIMRGQKIAIIGANGIGKSTLLKTIANRLSPLEGYFSLGHNVSLSFFAQDQLEIFDPNTSILENILNHAPKASEKQARQLLGGFLFHAEDVFKPVGVLSGGEKSRVGLASLLLQEANFLLLDEPTNHLDMSSAEVLANAIDEYEGTVLFVSHDRDFIDEVCTHVFVMTQDGRHALFEGKLDDYERLAAVANFPDILSPDKAFAQMTAKSALKEEILDPISKLSRDEQLEYKRERQKWDRQKQTCEKEIEKLTIEIKKFELILEKYALENDYIKINETNTKCHQLKEKLTEHEENWLQACEELEL